MRKLVLILVIVAFSSCSDSSVESGYGTIEGLVYDGETMLPIHFAEFLTQPPSSVVISDSTGKFRLVNLVAGDYSIKAAKQGYAPRDFSVKVTSGKTTKVTLLLFKGGAGGNEPIDLPDSLKDNLVAYYPFDGSAYDSGPMALHGSATKVDYIDDHKGNPRRAIFFRGDMGSCVYVNTITPFNLNEFTFSFWIKPYTGYGYDWNNYIDIISRWGHWGPVSQSYTFGLSKDGMFKAITYQYREGTDYGDPMNYSVVDGTSKILENKWTHVAITFRNNLVIVYLDGIQDNSSYALEPQPSSTYGLAFGRLYESTGGNPCYYYGALDEVYIFNKALTESSIKELMNK